MPEEWEKWVAPADDLIRQCYYRIVGAISFHAPIEESIKAVEYLAETKRGGTITYWGRTFSPLKPIKLGKLFRVWSWDDLDAYPDVKMSIWIYGSDYSSNTAFLRKKWYRLYLLRTLAKTLGTFKVT